MVMRPLNPPVVQHGKSINETVASITWYDGSLADSHFEDFGISMKLPAAQDGTVLYFSVTQECDNNTRIAWDQTGENASVPAAKLTLNKNGTLYTGSSVSPVTQNSFSAPSQTFSVFSLLLAIATFVLN
jgi:hypothetical protein